MSSSDHSAAIRKAVRFYWQSKHNALTENQAGKRIDQGKRGAATAGKNFDGFVQMLAGLALKHGSKDLQIHKNKSNVVLPGHFRPSKQWKTAWGHFVKTQISPSRGGKGMGSGVSPFFMFLWADRNVRAPFECPSNCHLLLPRLILLRFLLAGLRSIFATFCRENIVLQNRSVTGIS